MVYGLGKFVDHYLQPIARLCCSFVQSSYDFKTKITTLPLLPKTAHLFTADATAMYTNIDMQHALQVIQLLVFEHYRQHHYTACKPQMLMEALSTVMTTSTFQVGDCYFNQICGTVMGTPPAPPYATLYFSPHENQCVDLFLEVKHYFHFLDDVISIWIPTTNNNDEDLARYHAFQV